MTGKIARVYEKDLDYKGQIRRASREEPQYEIESDKTDHIAAHREAALTKVR